MLERMWRKRNPPYTIGGNVDWYSHYREQYGGSKKQPKVELAYDPAIPLLGLYQGKSPKGIGRIPESLEVASILLEAGLEYSAQSQNSHIVSTRSGIT